jgi:ABC-type branched-subunit amino acid transport system ATPase component
MTRLELQGVGRSFGGLRAIHDLTLAASSGEILGLIGPNGAGKTTAFNLMTGFIRQDTGTITLDKAVVDRWSPERRCEAGLVRTFQIVRPFQNITVLDNVVMGALMRARSLGEARKKAQEVLHTVGLGVAAQALARTLSIGDRKRLELAKALATDPKMLLLDEVMGGLIPIEVQRMMSLIRALRDKGLAVILIEHNMHAAMNLSDRIIVLHHGEKIAEGPPQEISRDPAVLSAYLGEGFVLSSVSSQHA